MIRGWLAYLGIILCALVFYIASPGYLSFYLLVVLLLLPILSLLLTLPTCLTLKLKLSPSARAVARGEDALFTLSPTSRHKQLHDLKLTWRMENLMLPQLSTQGTLQGNAGAALELPAPTQHCGWVRCTPVRCSVRDWLGLFRLPVRTEGPALLLVCPVDDPSGLPDPGRLGPGAPLHPRPGGGPGEEYDLRDYRPGDPVTAIHWKLTAKRPTDLDPILRETLEPVREVLAVCYDHFGTPDEVDRSLDRLSALAHLLLEQDRPFLLCWTDPKHDTPRYDAIDCPPAFAHCLHHLCAISAPLQGTPFLPEGPIPGHPGPVHRLRLSAGKEGTE